MILFSVISAILPGLDTPGFEAKLKHARLGRRLLAGATALLLTVGPSMVPVRAQMAVTDPGAWVQRSAEYVKDEWRFLDVKSSDAAKFLRNAAMAYQSYQQARALYQRVTSGNITLSLVDSLPVIDVLTNDSSGSEKMVIRPIFREQDRLNAPRVNVQVQSVDWKSMLKNLDFDISTVRTPTPDAQKSPQQIQMDAVSDGWLSWQLAQQNAPVDPHYWNIPNPNPQTDPYAPLREEIRQHYQDIGNALQSAAENAMQIYGGDSDQYLGAVDAVAKFQQILQSGVPDQKGVSLERSLQAFDAQAEIVIQKYAAARNELGMSMKRDAAKDQNLQQTHSGYTETPGNTQPYSLMDFIAGSTPAPPPGQAEGDAMKQTIQQESIATTANQQFKYDLTNDMRSAQSELGTLAGYKAKAINSTRDRLAQQMVSAKANVVIAELAKLSEEADMIRIQSGMPDNTQMIVRDQIAQDMPGTIPSGSPAADQVMVSNMKVISKANASLAEKIFADQVKLQSKGMAWNLVKPVFAGFDAAAQKLLGHSFNLTNWAGNS